MIKKPLVLTNGEIEQLQSGDALFPVPNSLMLTNGDIGTIPIGGPVYISAANTMIHATAEALPNVVGLVTEAVEISIQGVVQTDGKISALTTEWDAITGDTGGLVAGATYYLGGIGGLTTTVPTTIGYYLVRLGIAVNSTDLEIKISRPIKL